MSEPIIEIRNITKKFAGNIIAVDSVDIDIAQNEFFALLVHQAAARPRCCA